MNNAQNGNELSYFVSRLHWYVYGLWKLRVLKLYRDGDVTGVIFEKWNPLSYILFLIFFIATFVIGGAGAIGEWWSEDRFNFQPGPYFQSNPELLQFIPHNVKRIKKCP